MTPDDPRHGTNAGYIAHRRENGVACDECKRGRATYQRRRNYDQQLGRPRIIPSIGVQRRVHALQRMGWSLRVIALECGWAVPQDLYYALHSPTCSRRTWLRVARTYERLCMTSPPRTSGSVRARNRAERLGYAPPLAWDNIDDPAEQPNLGGVDDAVDMVVVDRILAHDASLARTATTAERRAVVAAWPGSLAELERLTGWRADRYVERPDGEVA